jgi:excisionase family DNA binding protein
MPGHRDNLLNTVCHPPDDPMVRSADALAEPSTAASQARLRDLSGLRGCMLLTIKDVMQLTGLGRTRIYEELAGPLQSVRVGRRRLIPTEAFEAWRAGLRPAARPAVGA